MGQETKANEKKFRQNLIFDVVLPCFAILFVQAKCRKISHLFSWEFYMSVPHLCFVIIFALLMIALLVP
jgi:hypothetical protein